MISKRVHDELMSVRRVLNYLPVSPSTEYGWTPHECQVFWAALDRYPRGPWTAIAEFIGTKSTRQAMTHGQKLRQKLKRWVTRLHRNPTARSLMNGGGVCSAAASTAISTSERASGSMVTKISVAVSTPLSTAATASDRAVPSIGVKSLAPQYPAGCQEEGAANFASERQPRLDVDMAASSAMVQVDGAVLSSRPPATEAYRSSTSLQMLFEPNTATVPTSTAMPAQLDETKHGADEADAIPHPINEVAMPVRHLLDELADVLWNETK